MTGEDLKRELDTDFKKATRKLEDALRERKHMAALQVALWLTFLIGFGLVWTGELGAYFGALAMVCGVVGGCACIPALLSANQTVIERARIREDIADLIADSVMKKLF